MGDVYLNSKRKVYDKIWLEYATEKAYVKCLCGSVIFNYKQNKRSHIYYTMRHVLNMRQLVYNDILYNRTLNDEQTKEYFLDKLDIQNNLL